ncbi:uncharacterized protein LOC105788169 isoform X3 [Gossypium raimondii]|uniref:uncharacterized protein LOC105788169 isoform X3 n=1 Tax=Gossypium raimondii TaxID=29730 RepID=UPI00227A24F1|nr:uncharacterized protein LOC105788169 isoform X3 [Gossypium raimondii]
MEGKGTKSGKTRAQKDAHNARCVQYRQKTKRRLEELEQVKTKYYEMLPIFKQMQTENQQMKMELKQNESIIQYMQNCIQQFKTTLEAQGQSYTSFDESIGWFLSQTNVQHGLVSSTSGFVVQDVNELSGLGVSGATNFQASMDNLYQQMGFGQYYNNTAASIAAGPSSVAPNSHGTKAGVEINSAAGFLGTNHDLPEFDVTTNHNNLFNYELGAANPEVENDGNPPPHTLFQGHFGNDLHKTP